MRSSFYRRLWRFNAIVIAALGLLSLVAIVAMLVSLWQSNQQDDLVRPETRGGEDAPFVVEQAEVQGTPSDQGTAEIDGFNALLINQQDGTSRYVLPNNMRRIVQWHLLPGQSAPRDAPKQAYIALVESSERGPVGGSAYDLLVGRLESGLQARVVRDVTSIGDPVIIGGVSLGVLIWKRGELTYLKVGLGDLRLQLSRKIPVKSVRN